MRGEFARAIALAIALAAGCSGDDDRFDAGPFDAGPGDAGPFDADANDSGSGPVYLPRAPRVLSVDLPGNDEDPAVLLARDGSIYVAWFSESAGNDILISRTTDGAEWTAPMHVTTGAATDFGPSLTQDAAGYIHAVWFRWAGATPPGRIVHNRSIAPDDGLAWDARGEVDVTHASGTDDWVPSLTADVTGTLVVAFARNTCASPTCYGIAIATSVGGDAWTDPAIVAVPAGSGVEHHLPAIANVDGVLRLAWTAFDDTAAAPWDGLTTGAHIELFTSSSGATWTDRREVTARDPAAVSLFPTLYADHSGAWHVAWLAADAAGQSAVEVPIDALGATPSTLPISGYSPRIIATPTPGVYLAASVEGTATNREIMVSVFAR